MLWGIGKTVIATAVITTMLMAGFSQANEVNHQDLLLVVNHGSPQNGSLWMPDQHLVQLQIPGGSGVIAAQPLSAAEVDLQLSGRGTEDGSADSRRVPESRTLALVGGGAILLGFALRCKPSKQQAGFSVAHAVIPVSGTD